MSPCVRDFAGSIGSRLDLRHQRDNVISCLSRIIAPCYEQSYESLPPKVEYVE